VIEDYEWDKGLVEKIRGGVDAIGNFQESMEILLRLIDDAHGEIEDICGVLAKTHDYEIGDKVELDMAIEEDGDEPWSSTLTGTVVDRHGFSCTQCDCCRPIAILADEPVEPSLAKWCGWPKDVRRV